MQKKLKLLFLFQKPTEKNPSTSKTSEETDVQETAAVSSGGASSGVNVGETSNGVQQNLDGGSVNVAANKEEGFLAKLLKKLNKKPTVY